MPAISIMIPCYNSAEWIEAALQSVYAQTFGDWEAIAVDDGSSDATLSILSRHAEYDTRVRVVRQSNKGVSAARNAALKMAEGDLFFFLDSDDLIPPSTLENLYKVLNDTGADIVQGKTVMFDKESKIERYLQNMSDKDCEPRCKADIISGREATILSLYQRKVEATLWGKLYRRFLFDGISFPEGEIYEDLSVFYKLTLRCGHYASIDSVTYLYRQRPDSQIHIFNPGRLRVLDATRRIQESVASDPELLKAAHDRRLAAAFNMLGLLLNAEDFPPARRTASIMQCRAIIKAFSRESICNPKVRLKNRLGAAMALLLPSSMVDRILKYAYR